MSDKFFWQINGHGVVSVKYIDMLFRLLKYTFYRMKDTGNKSKKYISL